MNSGKKEYSILWFIENYSCFGGQNLYNELISPDFTPQGPGGTSWCIYLYPELLKDNLHSVYLKRSAQDAGPESFSIKLEISIITVDGSSLYSEECEHTFRKGDKRGFKPPLDMDEIYVRRNTKYLPEDNLGVRCRMWKGEGSVLHVVQCSARTRIRFENISFLHRVENFSALKPEEVKTLQIPSHSKTGCVFSSSLVISTLDENDSSPHIFVYVKSSDSNYKLLKIKLYLIDVTGNNIEWYDIDFRFKYHPEPIPKTFERLSRQFILNKRKEFLPNDELSLICECNFATGVECKIEEILHDIPVMSYKNRFCNALSKNGDNDPHRDKYNAAEKMSISPSALDDFKALYNDQLLTDVVLKTATKSFPSHKIVLCARSSVFRAMLTNDMKEKNTDCIKVEDMENETVQRLLLFLYSDNLEELQWESALKLYYAGDKYAIEKLKVLCSSFLVDNLSPSTASELLLLADTHSDSNLKKFVEDFILEHEKEVFGSDEWEKLIETNPQLVIKTMHLKYKREKVGK